MQQDGIIYARLLHIRKKTPRKLLDMTDDTTFASLAHSLLRFRISMLNLERKSSLEAIQNDCSFIRFITVSDLQLIQRLDLNPQIVYRTIAAHQSVPFDFVAFVLEVGSHRFSKSDVYDVAPKATSQITE